MLLNAEISKTNVIFSRQTLDTCLLRAYNALKQTARVASPGSHGNGKTAKASYSFGAVRAFFAILRE